MKKRALTLLLCLVLAVLSLLNAGCPCCANIIPADQRRL